MSKDYDEIVKVIESEQLKKLLGPFKQYISLPFDDNESMKSKQRKHILLGIQPPGIDSNEFGKRFKLTMDDLTISDLCFRELKECAMKEIELKRKGIVVSNIDGGFHSTPDFLNRYEQHLTTKTRDELFRVLREAASERLSSDDHIKITSSWINRLGKGNSNGLHNHANAKLSGVFYFDDDYFDEAVVDDGQPKPGDLILRVESSALRKNCTVGERTSFVHITPRKGLLVLFDSDLLHCVMPSNRGQRLSLAFNFAERNVSYEDPNDMGKAVVNVGAIDLSHFY